MMSALAPKIADDATPCRCCGAEFARPGKSRFGICYNCERLMNPHWSLARKYPKNANREEVDWANVPDHEFNAFLVRRMVVQIGRREADKTITRCEAISNQPWGTGINAYYQCGNEWTVWRDGRKVCAAHNYKNENWYINKTGRSDHDLLVEKILDACRADKKLSDALIKALQSAGYISPEACILSGVGLEVLHRELNSMSCA